MRHAAHNLDSDHALEADAAAKWLMKMMAEMGCVRHCVCHHHRYSNPPHGTATLDGVQVWPSTRTLSPHSNAVLYMRVYIYIYIYARSAIPPC